MPKVPKVQIIFPPASRSALVGWTVGCVLGVIDGFSGQCWERAPDPEATVVIFVADRQRGARADLDLAPLRSAVSNRGQTIFVVTGLETTVSPGELGRVVGRGQIYFFHAMMSRVAEGFFPLALLAGALQRALDGLSMEGLGEV